MKFSRFASAIMMLVLGVLFIWKQADVISIATWVLGIALIVLGVLDLLAKNTIPAIVKAALGVVILVLGNTLINVALTIIAIIMIALGAVQFVELFRRRASGTERLFSLASAALYVLIGVLLFLGHLMNWMFIVIGIFMIVDALCDIAYGVKTGKGRRR